MRSTRDLYVGTRCVALFDGDERVWAHAVGGLDAALAIVHDRLKANGSPLRLRVWLSGGLCRPFMLPMVSGVKGKSELQRTASAMAPRLTGLEGECAVWMDDGDTARARLAVALQRRTLQGVNESTAGHRVLSVQPWWADVLRAAMRSEPSLPALAVQDCDSLTLLTGAGDNFDSAASLFPVKDRETADAALLRRMLASGLAPSQELVVRIAPLGECHKASLPVALAPCVEISR